MSDNWIYSVYGEIAGGSAKMEFSDNVTEKREGIDPVEINDGLMLRARAIAKRVPGLRKLVRIFRRGPTFYTASPDVLVALVRAFNIQRDQQQSGDDVLNGFGYYEFGMYRGFSFWFAEQLSREYAPENFSCFGFDSFAGLPQPKLKVEDSMFLKGDYSAGYELVTENLTKMKADFNRIRLFKGYFSDELFDHLNKTENFPKISICLIDVDLYDSCVPVLRFIKPLLVPNTILVFDDYNQMGADDTSGERLALKEFLADHQTVRIEHLFDYGWEGMACKVTAV